MLFFFRFRFFFQSFNQHVRHVREIDNKEGKMNVNLKEANTSLGLAAVLAIFCKLHLSTRNRIWQGRNIEKLLFYDEKLVCFYRAMFRAN